VFGLLAGVSRVLAQRSLSGRFQSEDDVRRHVPLAVYGTIPTRSKRETEKSILSQRPQGAFSEGFRLLRSNINQSGLDPGSRIILITSASTGDGKTMIASNLADILADDDTRVVLVDGDLHRGRLREVLHSQQRSGLTEWLATGRSVEIETLLERRFLLIPAGMLPPNPSELLRDSRLGDIFKTLRSSFDYIIVDCPPLPSVADSLMFGKYADLILSVVRMEHTMRRNLKSHNEVLATLNVRRGMIINETTGNDYGYGYGYGYGENRNSRKGISKLIGNVIKLVSRL
jgi:capsular exopolysaccharide synthesis family protein